LTPFFHNQEDFPSTFINYHKPERKWAKRKKSLRDYLRHSPKERKAGYIEIDTIVTFQNGIRKYIFDAVDVLTKFEF